MLLYFKKVIRYYAQIVIQKIISKELANHQLPVIGVYYLFNNAVRISERK
jgi:hypothetical protein